MTRNATSTLIAHLTSATAQLAFDLYTIQLLNGVVLMWTDADQALYATDGRHFTLGPVLIRERVSWSRGISVNDLKVTMAGNVAISGTPLIPFIAAGGFDSAAIKVERIYLDLDLAVKGQLEWFTGTVADIELERSQAILTVKSDTQGLDVMMPRNLFQPECVNDLYDARCTVNRALYAVNASVAAVDPTNARGYLLTYFAGRPSNYFNLGVLKFTSGQNVGQSRTVKLHRAGPSTSDFQFARPFPFAIAANDTFTVAPGCDKTTSTCRDVYANFDASGTLHHYTGTPFIPAPEVAT